MAKTFNQELIAFKLDKREEKSKLCYLDMNGLQLGFQSSQFSKIHWLIYIGWDFLTKSLSFKYYKTKLCAWSRFLRPSKRPFYTHFDIRLRSVKPVEPTTYLSRPSCYMQIRKIPNRHWTFTPKSCHSTLHPDIQTILVQLIRNLFPAKSTAGTKN